MHLSCERLSSIRHRVILQFVVDNVRVAFLLSANSHRSELCVDGTEIQFSIVLAKISINNIDSMLNIHVIYFAKSVKAFES